MHLIVKLALLIAGLIHLLPLAGVLGADRLYALYGVTIGDPAVLLLMRHRAVLFGLLGAFCTAAAFLPRLQAGALLMALGSVLSFLVLAWPARADSAAIARIAAVDLGVLALLLAAMAVWVIAPESGLAATVR